jgi:hypothetical protein
MSIVSVSQFQKANELNIPLSVQAPVSNSALQSVNDNAYLVNLIAREEKTILLNALGLATYNTLQLAISDDFTNPIYASYKKLVEGEQYDGKIWEGLEYDYSLILYRVYDVFLTETNNRLSSIGTVAVNPQGAVLQTPVYKIANANANFIRKYQGGYLREPIISDDGLFVDWYGQQEAVNVSLYKYLIDKKADFVNWSEQYFIPTNEIKNSFGI